MRAPASLSRRHCLAVGAALGLPPWVRYARAADVPRFALGVASGQPRAQSIVLWTRLTGADLPAQVPVRWELAHDERFTGIAARGSEIALATEAHSVHAEPTALEPGRWYWYRFEALGQRSTVGRTRTAPAPDVREGLRFALASCQRYDHGHYAAWRHIANAEFDLVLFVGDYIYEYASPPTALRRHEGLAVHTLEQYRARYAQYKGDPLLQAAHAAFPWLSTWDDHEVTDDYANDRSYTVRDPERFLKIRAAAYQAYYEHMPLPLSARPVGPDATIYAHYRFGDMLDMLLIDDRQYRSAPACVQGGRPTTVPDCAERTEEARTMLGRMQEQWMDRQLAEGGGRWTIVAQQTLMAEARHRDAEGGDRYWMDGWDGYPNARRRLLDAVVARKVRNPVVIGGDRHAYFAANLKRDFSRPDEATIATEFVGTSITSDGPGPGSTRSALANNPELLYANGEKRGYAVMDLDGRSCTVGFEALDNVKDAQSPVRRLATFVVEDGVPGAKAA